MHITHNLLAGERVVSTGVLAVKLQDDRALVAPDYGHFSHYGEFLVWVQFFMKGLGCANGLVRRR